MPDLRDVIRRKAMELGFDAVGFAPASGDPAWRQHLDSYVAEGRHGEMAWMEERREQRASPVGLWPECRSVLVLGSSYAPGAPALSLLAHPERGNISVYARNKDYHDLIKRRLKALARWMVESHKCDVKVFVDTAPVMEKPLAVQGGLGWQGRHGNMVSRRHGGWLFLAEIYTTLDLPADQAEPDHCGRCTACVAACPTAAIQPGRRVEPRRCISYLTIEHKGPIPEELRPLMGNRIYGCDDCLAACPWNKFATPTSEADFLPRAELTAPRLADLAQLNDADFREIFAGSPIKRIGRDRFVRNVLIALGNSARPDLAKAASALTDDPAPVVADAAHWAVRRLQR